MITEVDDKTGLVKTYWSDIRDRVNKIEPQFTKIVDKLNPDQSFPLYLAYYPYGAMDADTESTLFPDMNGGYFRVTDANAPKEIVEQLGYSANNTPLGMVIDKQIESFIDLKSAGVTIPWMLYTPGKMFPLTRLLHTRNKRIYSPNGLLSSTAGSRSIFMLPNIGCMTNHINLQREFNVRNPTPKSMYEHWDIFKEIIYSEKCSIDWRCCVMYFSEKWVDKIINDKAWIDLNRYLHESAWHQFEYEISRSQYDFIFSIIQKNRNLKPNPYLADTAKHLFSIAIGSTPGFAPAMDESSMPLKTLQQAYVESYGLKKYFPTIMQPVYFNYETDQYPIYYSLQNPSTHAFSPKSREASSTLFEMRELEYIMKIFVQEMSKKQSMCTDTIMGTIANNVKFNYFHNKKDRHGIISLSSTLANTDERFYFSTALNQAAHPGIAVDSPFMRGCISISPT